MLRVRPDGAIEIDVHAVPRSSRDALGKLHDGRLKLHIKAAPVDGEANAAIIKLLSKTLGLPRDRIDLVRGQTGKRKTVRISGFAPDSLDAAVAELREALGLPSSDTQPSGSRALGALLVGLVGVNVSACESARELPITVILPADTSDYSRADNATVVMRPSGDVYSFDANGIDFSLELEGAPTTELQQLELYLADGEELIAWGSTVPFATASPDVGLALFLGRPGLLSSWPELLDTPDPQLLGAQALGRGMLLVQSDGDTFLLNHYSLALESGSRLPDSINLPGEVGGLFSAANGTLVRLAWEQAEAIAWRYDPGADAWTELSFADGGAALGARPGAAVLRDPDATRVYLLGGGDSLDGVAVDLIANQDDALATAPVADFALDATRDGATALWIPTSDDPTADVLLVGGQTSGPVALLASAGVSVGPSMAWRELGCSIQTQPAPAPGEALTVLCVGGSIDDVATADALSIDVIPGDAATVEQLESFLPTPIPDPLVLSDETALYTQGEGRWFRIARDNGSVSEPDSAPQRASGGHLVSLANGVTFVVGGVGKDGAALDRWQVFTPALGL